MDPYQSPHSEFRAPSEEPKRERGLPCLACGSLNTSKDKFFRARPSVISVMLFGWFFLVVKAAFHVRSSECRDCGANRRYKTTGSKVALGFVGFVLFLIVLAVVSEINATGAL
ncbi:hypothetical protein [Roseibacillus persicicus]|uniref:hypothetical protein n=1 Tax=Roseibacillus persicicus TaxID=454148 RepID=UPI00280EF9E6|nr:hypothetical protein [Roseibacillus persicicus]MDQ8189714.1 hypothetical protein [Roseibacillus persicicus]